MKTKTPETDAAAYELNEQEFKDFARKLESERDAARAWHTMETAPKDGTFIHVAAHVFRADGSAVSWSMIGEWSDFDGGRWIDRNADYSVRPEWAMGWRPIPALPTSPVTESK